MTHRCRRCGEAGHNVRTCTQHPREAAVTALVNVHRHLQGRPSRASKIVRMVPNLEALQKRVDRYREVLDCPGHYQDNQGLCHQCGIVMDPELARAEGACT